MNVNAKNLRLVLFGSLIISVLIFIIVLSAGLKFLSGQSKSLVKLKVQSQTADLQLSTLEQSKKAIEQYSYFKGVAATVIPSDKNEAQTVVDIFQMASQSGFQIQSITFPTSSLGLTTGTTGTTGTADATSPSSAKAALSQAKPVTTIAGLYSLQLTIQPIDKNPSPGDEVTYDKMIDFLQRIENDRRTAQIAQITITSGGQNTTGFTFSLTINTFLKP